MRTLYKTLDTGEGSEGKSGKRRKKNYFHLIAFTFEKNGINLKIYPQP